MFLNSKLTDMKKEFIVKEGETLGSLLESTGVKGDDISEIVRELKTLYNPRYIKPGQKIKLILFKRGEQPESFHRASQN